MIIYKNQIVKYHFDMYDNDTNIISNHPPHILEEDWDAFVNDKSNPNFHESTKQCVMVVDIIVIFV